MLIWKYRPPLILIKKLAPNTVTGMEAGGGKGGQRWTVGGTAGRRLGGRGWEERHRREVEGVSKEWAEGVGWECVAGARTGPEWGRGGSGGGWEGVAAIM